MKKWIIQVFILVHCVAIFSWAYPYPSALRKRTKTFFEPYLSVAGLRQNWSMFAPNPMSINLYVDADIKFKDGTRKIWSFPRVSKLGFFEKLFQERERKWTVDAVRLDEHSNTWPYLAKYVARTQWDDKNPPITVSLNRHWSNIAAPTSQFYQPLLSEYPATNHFSFYHYNVPNRRPL